MIYLVSTLIAMATIWILVQELRDMERVKRWRANKKESLER
jgi:hypothetical protein